MSTHQQPTQTPVFRVLVTLETAINREPNRAFMTREQADHYLASLTGVVDSLIRETPAMKLVKFTRGIDLFAATQPSTEEIVAAYNAEMERIEQNERDDCGVAS